MIHSQGRSGCGLVRNGIEPGPNSRGGTKLKQLKHPATVIAALALFVALSGGAVAAVAVVINGSQIKNHSIAAKKLTAGAINSLHGQRGLQGIRGPQGVQGVQGPQGPGATLLSYDAAAVLGTPAPTPLGTILGNMYGATCISSGGNVTVRPYIQTPDGSWIASYTGIVNPAGGSVSDGTSALNIAAGTLSGALHLFLGSVSAPTGGSQSDIQFDFLQLSQSPGEVIMHSTVKTTPTSANCYLTIQGIPEQETVVHGAPRASSTVTSHLPTRLFH
jgi:hypothetical protein